jgi:hypothetical protein
VAGRENSWEKIRPVEDLRGVPETGGVPGEGISRPEVNVRPGLKYVSLERRTLGLKEYQT